MFKADGTIGGTAEKVGGPFARNGIVGLVSPFLHPSFSLCQTAEVKSDPILQSCERWCKERFNARSRREKAAEYYWVERLLEEFPNVA
jgi:hypothetical protein